MGRDFRVIIAGGRKFDDYEAMKEALKEWKKERKVKSDDKITVICGCAEGADDLGRKWAFENNYEVAEFPANWKLLGKTAGILRNKEMAKFAAESDDNALLAFWNGKSKGTKNMIDTAIQHKIPITILSYKDPEYKTSEIVREYIGDMEEAFKEIFTNAFGNFMNPPEEDETVEASVKGDEDNLEAGLHNNKVNIEVKSI